MVGVCDLAKILASNEAIKNEVESSQKILLPRIRSVDVTSSPELGTRINERMKHKSKASFEDIEGITQEYSDIIKSNISKFKKKYLVNKDEIEYEKYIKNCFFDGRCDVYVKDKCIVEVKAGEDKHFHLIQLALYNIMYEEKNCDKARLKYYLFNPIKGYIHGGDITPLCNKIKEVVNNNYAFLNFDSEGTINLKVELFNNGGICKKDPIAFLKLNNNMTVIIDCKNYNPSNKCYKLKKIINDNKDSFIFFNKDALGN